MIERRVLADGSLRWKVRIKSGGELVAQRTFRLKGDAETWEREQTRALQFGQFLPPRNTKVKLGTVIDEFVHARKNQVVEHTQRTDRDNLAAIPKPLQNRPISAVTQSDILGFLSDQLEIKERSTVARLRTTLGALFTFALREKYVSFHPVRGLELPPGSKQKPPEEWFTDETLAATLEAQYMQSPFYARISEWLSLTGLRWSENRALRVYDLQDVPYPGIKVTKATSEGYSEKTTKTAHGQRVVPLTARGLEIAREAAKDKKPDDLLFTGPGGKQLRMNLYRRLTHWAETAPRKRPHMLRHYRASKWLRAGIPVHQVAEWLGDDPRTVLKVYAHVLGDSQNIESLRRLNDLEATQGAIVPAASRTRKTSRKRGGEA